MDLEYMKRVIELAGQGSGFVNPDPLSGALLVKDGRILGEGCYDAYHSEPAEIKAFRQAEGDTVGSKLYLNIEPFHPLIQMQDILNLIKEKGIVKVLIGILDPNPEKEMDFLEELIKLGIDYETGVLIEACEELNEIYSYYIQHKEPFVIVKWAMTLDGKLATRTGDSKWISSDDSLRFVHQLRQRVAAIMVGENTVKLDDPMLTTRLSIGNRSNPLRVIVSKYGDIPMEAKVLQVDETVKTIIIASEYMPQEREHALLRKGVQVAKLREQNHRINFRDIMRLLGSMNIDSLYIEGGSAILASAFESDCVHKVYTAIAPKIIGGRDAFTPVGGEGIEYMRDAIVLKRISHEIIGPDVIVKGYIK
ncbi:MAG: diaminohydroxyphosphoribosylaminopyrimidine deaminase [Herbinix sp.]|jgi:diaminohydroxyphosphoribosylaminopyrimidine deaminase/5-amino-6-(5-phosphoribosylamino)uracil reductase|nr:diaminohydroxyphosphoribosylaminopyrimidine deaminase [Herbinix sp.]